MTTPVNNPIDLKTTANKLDAKLSMVRGAIERIRDNIHHGELTPHECAYIDTQLYKAIGWLASCRAIVVVAGELDKPHFDHGDLVDLDKDIDAELDRWGVPPAKVGGA